MSMQELWGIRGSAVQTGAVPAAFSVLGALLVACSGPQLVPVTATESGTARVERAGIVLEVDASGGGHPVYLPADVEPLRISIHNGSDSGIHVSLDAIELVKGGSATVTGSGSNGSLALAPLSPASIEPRPIVRGTGLDPASPFNQPIGAGVDLRLATQYPVPNRELTFGDTGVDARRAEIVGKAFSDGFIGPGETREGFVYFPEPPTNVHQLDLVIPLHTGQGSGALTTLSVPLAVQT